jgi:hypothetical protein
MFQKYESLKKLDNVLISNQEFDSTLVWNEMLNPSHLKTKLRKLKPENPKQPPKHVTEDPNKKQNQGGN